jgi:hypothetical protein
MQIAALYTQLLELKNTQPEKKEKGGEVRSGSGYFSPGSF